MSTLVKVKHLIPSVRFNWTHVVNDYEITQFNFKMHFFLLFTNICCSKERKITDGENNKKLLLTKIKHKKRKKFFKKMSAHIEHHQQQWWCCGVMVRAMKIILKERRERENDHRALLFLTYISVYERDSYPPNAQCMHC